MPQAFSVWEPSTVKSLTASAACEPSHGTSLEECQRCCRVPDRQWLWGGARFDVASEGGEWVPVASMSRARGSLGVASVSGQVVACGGGVHEAQYDSVEMCAHGYGYSKCACDASTTRHMSPMPAPCAFCFSIC